MFRSIRLIAAIAAAATLAACSESSPTGVADDAAFAKGSGSTTTSSTASRIEIVLIRPANAVYRSAKGKAKFASKASERELQVEVENVPVGTDLTIALGGTVIGTAKADAFGKARLNLNSTLGQTVPMSVTGQSVTVTSAAGAVVSGSF